MGEEIRSCAGKCVLVVDDNEFNRELVREILDYDANGYPLFDEDGDIKENVVITSPKLEYA